MPDVDSVMLADRIVGKGYSPLVIAEMSANHNGDFDRACSIVKAVASSGAEAIKLQTFKPESLTVDCARPEFYIHEPDSLWHGERLLDLYRKAYTPWEWHAPLFELARSLGLICISTAFDEESVDFLLQVNVDAIKIASFELVHIPLIAKAANSGKPVLISTGMGSTTEIDDAVNMIRSRGCESYMLFKCTSAYPAIARDANVLTIPDMSKKYACNVGISDHAVDPYSSYAAVAVGAVAIEKHITLRRDDGGVDAGFSLEPQELSLLVSGVNMVWESLGSPKYTPCDSEAASLAERPSIYVVKDMQKGDEFTEGNIRVIRPGSGLAPKHYWDVLGRRAVRKVEANTPLAWEFVETKK